MGRCDRRGLASVSRSPPPRNDSRVVERRRLKVCDGTLELVLAAALKNSWREIPNTDERMPRSRTSLIDVRRWKCLRAILQGSSSSEVLVGNLLILVSSQAIVAIFTEFFSVFAKVVVQLSDAAFLSLLLIQPILDLGNDDIAMP